MIKQAYIRGFLNKLAQYGIDPSSIYGNHTLATTDYDLGFDPPDINAENTTSAHIGFKGNPNFGFLTKALPLLGRFAYNQYSNHRGGPRFLTYSRKF